MVYDSERLFSEMKQLLHIRSFTNPLVLEDSVQQSSIAENISVYITRNRPIQYNKE